MFVPFLKQTCETLSSLLTYASSCLTHVCFWFEIKLYKLVMKTFEISCITWVQVQFLMGFFIPRCLFPPKQFSFFVPSISLGAHTLQSKSKWQNKHLQEFLLIAVVTVGNVHRNQQRWGGNKDKLKTPEADVGDREELIVADILTARLKNRHSHIECVTAENRPLRSCFIACSCQKTRPQCQVKPFISFIRSNKIQPKEILYVKI